MSIKKLQRIWNEFAETAPLEAILSRGQKWETSEFFETGRRDVADLMKYIELLGITMNHGKALDFGCGVGRLTQALADHFDEVCGVDIAPSMIELARKYNRHGDRCKYYLNETDDLELFDESSFDLVYSVITLQHMKPRYSKRYIKQFLRVLTPEGLLVFQLTGELAATVGKLKSLVQSLMPEAVRDWYLRSRGIDVRSRCYGIQKEEVVRFLNRNKGRVVDVVEDQAAGPGWKSYRYCVAKEGHILSSPLR